MSIFYEDNQSLFYHFDAETVQIEPWGQNSFRVRATKEPSFTPYDWALYRKPEAGKIEIDIQKDRASIINGKCKATILNTGKITFYSVTGKILLDECLRTRRDVHADYCSALEREAREFRPNIGGDYHLSMRFESDPNEKIYGMGMYQEACLNLKGTDLELAQRNSQASVPFMISSQGYGFLWNNPAVGRVVFGKNRTTWEAYSTTQLDYWITAGDSPSEIEESYAAVSGTVPMMPDFAMGFWQCKLRYQTQDELLRVAREYKKRGLPISVIVIDFFHWDRQGNWKFDPTYWPDPEKMIKELHDMGIELMVSIWPTVEQKSENYQEMLEKGYLIRTERGLRISMDFQDNTIHFDATNPGARKFIWEKAKENYYDKGIHVFWLDEAEPEYSVYDFDNYRYYLGPNLKVGNAYPEFYAKAFYDGMTAEGQKNVLNLVRCAWAGSQKYGALVWSGDIPSSFLSLRRQIVEGLNMGMAGIPWFTTDIGGFHGGNPDDPKFRELLVRWFEFGCFCPVMRLHGDREPQQNPLIKNGRVLCASGADNEVWSFGDEAYDILKYYLNLREQMKEYISQLMLEAHEKGTPVMRTLFYEFPKDKKAWEIEDEYLFGPNILVAPVLNEGARERTLYLPKGAVWENYWTHEKISGGQTVCVNAPLEQIPLFLKKEK